MNKSKLIHLGQITMYLYPAAIMLQMCVRYYIKPPLTLPSAHPGYKLENGAKACRERATGRLQCVYNWKVLGVNILSRPCPATTTANRPGSERPILRTSPPKEKQHQLEQLFNQWGN